jgi:hypothetical protein
VSKIDKTLLNELNIGLLKLRDPRVNRKPPGFLYTIKHYPCGCSAEGPGDVPNYCSIHGAIEQQSPALPKDEP